MILDFQKVVISMRMYLKFSELNQPIVLTRNYRSAASMVSVAGVMIPVIGFLPTPNQ
jgi:hypothetical protein